jgi:hypothetical protein
MSQEEHALKTAIVGFRYNTSFFKQIIYRIIVYMESSLRNVKGKLSASK